MIYKNTESLEQITIFTNIIEYNHLEVFIKNVIRSTKRTNSPRHIR